MRVVVRPDGRRFVREPVDESGVFATAPEDDLARWLAAGFAVHRREDVYVVRTRKRHESHPFLHLDDVAPDYTGICRVWLREPTPRLGFVGVRRPERGRGLGHALVAAALGEAHALGYREVTTEIDVENTPSQALFRSFGARRIGGSVELVRTT